MLGQFQLFVTLGLAEIAHTCEEPNGHQDDEHNERQHYNFSRVPL